MGRAETMRRLKSSVFLIVVGLGVGSLIGVTVTPHRNAPSDSVEIVSHPGVRVPSAEEDLGDHGAHADHLLLDDPTHGTDDAHATAAAPVVTQNSFTQSGKQSWSNPAHRETYKTMYNEYHKLRSGANVCHSCRFLDGLFKLYKFKNVLDAGCGTAVMVRKLRAQGIDARGIEAASLPLEEYAKDLLANGTVFSVPMQEIPFETGRFDLITSVEVFEHIPEADVDRSINELSRVAKPGAAAFITVGQSTSRFDTAQGRAKSAVAAISTKFKFHETVKPRQWWIDTFCAHGFYEDPSAYMTMVKMANEGGLSRPPPRGWLALVKAKPGSKPCKCTVPPGRQSNWFCGQGRPNAKRDVAKLWAELREQ